ncbi:4-(cytidine 5'-diphospho)-2-C-methyl-D-erythritol kinase [Fulvivirga sp. RKSG066]|uniref:4-(cytidine 5'-diphospho)-2-C-methyl-D-erythritol kinase n=1 Tax=Fulvivirga aurantia TaxID=2529383 RepID=UPI0012BB97F2|nr:4-(cytidine 5'-diphospho)-2-C-methyl-D-erythritol kinase [Fulvivirga aurantia]MTI21573.1 4-(cytidine 5'-diphospho)-2-C-methyl-D-erythritol kinase [Fulvivirga aurantia]
MVVFPNAKINLGLNIISKRTDGYHNISSCFYPIPLTDILEVKKSEQFEFNSTGIEIPGEGNLCIKAFEILKQKHGIGPVNIHLHKIVPIGAGLGGGSADASFTLKCLNELFNLQLTNKKLENYASQLGSDCPFFIQNNAVMASGTGTDFSDIDFDLSGRYLVLINPGIHVSTASAYNKVKPQQAEHQIENVLSLPIDEWKDKLHNDFEDSVFPQFPAIGEIKEQLLTSGAQYASMTGSGSSVYAIFDTKPELPESLVSNVVWQGQLD